PLSLHDALPISARVLVWRELLLHERLELGLERGALRVAAREHHERERLHEPVLVLRPHDARFHDGRMLGERALDFRRRHPHAARLHPVLPPPAPPPLRSSGSCVRAGSSSTRKHCPPSPSNCPRRRPPRRARRRPPASRRSPARWCRSIRGAPCRAGSR